ncbi:MAG: glutaredoxin domain-containing protein [Pseudomonadota bacterium]
MDTQHRAGLLVCATFAYFLSAPASGQTLGEVFRTIKQVASSNNIGAVQSVAQAVQGRVDAGAELPNADGKVILYRTAWCGYCKRAAAYMQRKGVAFVERDIETKPSHKDEYVRAGGGRGVPFIVFGEKTMTGFSENAFDKHYAAFQLRSAAAPSGRGVGDVDLRSDMIAPQAGQTMLGKIAGVKVYTQPSKTSEKLVVLSKTDEVIYMGEERDGLYRVTTEKGDGWVDKLLLRKL